MSFFFFLGGGGEGRGTLCSGFLLGIKCVLCCILFGNGGMGDMFSGLKLCYGLGISGFQSLYFDGMG